MVKEVTKYEAIDGTQWATEQQAVRHENLVLTVKGIMVKLPELDISGHNFYQHIPADVLSVQVTLAKLAFIAIGNDQDRHHYDAVINADKPMGLYSLIGRFLDDCGGPISRAWTRLMRIDSKFREWEQPYYAINTPTDAVEIK